MEDKINKVIYYIIEHFESEVSRWTLCEYAHMILILNNLYNDATVVVSNKLIITNYKFKALLHEGKLQEDELKTLQHTKDFEKINANLGNKCLVSQYSLLELTT